MFWQRVICHFLATILQLKVAKRRLFEKVSLEYWHPVCVSRGYGNEFCNMIIIIYSLDFHKTANSHSNVHVMCVENDNNIINIV